ncbi:hypothetical protein PAXRUDRAFT_18990 [Paxillus rubicundulus Ve08.2h10]|uniref:Uncharacterized protein n=1 Tax=Paxillus rubicundulus Ve08.2h10 TaxID=930991 RepID=A0A0D0CJX2_9AGAM|nr:hypothetical protein PAXRUDRAFT_18990 [Paxillus rubicundulus Ve08.2h10]
MVRQKLSTPVSYCRETVKELGDSLASPTGCNTLPVSSDPSVEESDGLEWAIHSGAQPIQHEVTTFSHMRTGMGGTHGCTTGILRVQLKPQQTSLSPPQ